MIHHNWLTRLHDAIESIHMGTGEPIKDILNVLVHTYGYELKEKEQ